MKDFARLLNHPDISFSPIPDAIRVDNPAIGDESIQRGILLPIYNIEPFDYEILINTTTKSEIPTEWVVFKNEVSLPLQIKSGRLAVEDIFMIMNWDYESNYSCSRSRHPYVASNKSDSKRNVNACG